MRKDIPENVAKAIMTLKDYCLSKECCSNCCPFSVPEYIETETSRCAFHQGSPSQWNVRHTYFIEWRDENE